MASNAAGNCIAAVLWSQGESDVGEMSGANYQLALDRMITTLRSRLDAGGADGAIHPRPVLARLDRPDADRRSAGDPRRDQRHAEAARLVPPSSSTAGLKSNVTQGLNGAIHLDAQSHRIYGKRYREALPVAMANRRRAEPAQSYSLPARLESRTGR